jgi:hypothetical protein
MHRPKQLKDENSKLRKVVADLSFDKEMLQEACPEVQARRRDAQRLGCFDLRREGCRQNQNKTRRILGGCIAHSTPQAGYLDRADWRRANFWLVAQTDL